MTNRLQERFNSNFVGLYYQRAMAKQCQLLFLLLLVFALITINQLLFTNERTTIREHIPDYPNASNKFHEQHLNIDRRHRSHDSILNDLQNTFSYLPITVWRENRTETLYYKNKTCAPFPSFYSIKINNLYYQILSTQNGTFYLYGAYYDTRELSPIGPTIRVLAMIDRIHPDTIKTYCQIWFSHSTEPVIVRTIEYRHIWDPQWGLHEGVDYSYLITCPIPQSSRHLIPKFVSLVEKECDAATNSFRVVYDKLEDSRTKDHFAVCVKNLDFVHVDQSVRLIEWIEITRLLGAKKIYFYDLRVHENVTKVLKYYEQRGDVETRPITYAGYQPNIAGLQHLYSYGWEKNVNRQRQQNILISLNDCFYRNMYKYDYIVAVDTDEVIMPLMTDNWTDLMNAIRRKAHSRSYYIAKNVLFVPDDGNSTSRYADVPSYMYMLQHVLREANHFNSRPKAFFDTKIVKTVHNHLATSCLTPYCSGYGISTNDAQLHHYRDEVYSEYGRRASDTTRVNDTSIWRYKNVLIDRTLAVLNDLHFFE